MVNYERHPMDSPTTVSLYRRKMQQHGVGVIQSGNLPTFYQHAYERLARLQAAYALLGGEALADFQSRTPSITGALNHVASTAEAMARGKDPDFTVTDAMGTVMGELTGLERTLAHHNGKVV